ncbi:MAG: glycine dehydrogenase (aminomethyl-transferring) [Planctomycetes bacterium]|nr:glycine dehydrogenase (aminomethyl-transferring) [Planctomycetota bacterium]
MSVPFRSDSFPHRHLGPRDSDLRGMLDILGLESLKELVDRAVPPSIRTEKKLDLPPPRGEMECLAELAELAGKNSVLRSYIGMGYHDCVTPLVIQRNILENPGWYTQYTAYQAEISQGRLELLFNFQTMVLDLTGMECANSSLLDEGTAAAEAMTLCHRVQRDERNRFLVDANTHPQSIAVVQTRAEPLGIEVVVQPVDDFDFDATTFGALVSYPGTDGRIVDCTALCERAHAAGALVAVCTDLLALTTFREPGKIGADIVVGNTQRFGVPPGYGGPHAAFLATRDAYKRQMPGRIVGMTVDSTGRPALRLALQTREQHIRREKATSNICTAQVLLAVIAAAYASYHGPEGLTAIAQSIRTRTETLAAGLEGLGFSVAPGPRFDTVCAHDGPKSAADIVATALAAGINLRDFGDGRVGVTFDETVGDDEVREVFTAFGGDPASLSFDQVAAPPAPFARTSGFLGHPVFHDYHCETEMLRYLKRLENLDLSLTQSMIPLGSCTMKLNATAEMVPIGYPGFSRLHPFVPADQATGYRELHTRLEGWLSQLTGFAACSLQPNAGSQGEYAGLLMIRALHQKNGQSQRNVCVIPSSAHGTNPASAKLAGMEVVVTACDDAGNVDLADLRARCAAVGDRLAALMITYPSTHGVYETTIIDICEVVHEHGGRVYFDGANLNALVGVAMPGEIGADVCHLNLHKTFCIPHGGGGPGMGPICVTEELAPFVPTHPVVATGGQDAIGAISSAPWGSASILPISYAYIAMMGAKGLCRATAVAILNANYIAKRLEGHYPVLYRGPGGWIAHECILDTRQFKSSAGIEVADIAKRLMDYGFHAPTVSFPVAGTLMVEPTESESKAELDRFCTAMIAIREEIRDVEEGRADRAKNVLKGAPHTSEVVAADEWSRPYSREQAAFPTATQRRHKYWPPVGRVDDVHGDRNLICACPSAETYA